jgi:hypothetical protein
MRPYCPKQCFIFHGRGVGKRLTSPLITFPGVTFFASIKGGGGGAERWGQRGEYMCTFKFILQSNSTLKKEGGGVLHRLMSLVLELYHFIATKSKPQMMAMSLNDFKLYASRVLLPERV